MFGKLCKYEWKYMMRFFLPMWGVLLVLGIINAFSAPHWLFDYSSQGMEIAGGLLFLALYLGFAAVCIVSLVVVIQRFYNGLLKDEGYLMFTLPVKSGALINSKLLVSVVLMFITAVVGLVSIMTIVVSGVGWGDFWDGFAWVFRESALSGLEWTMIIVWLIVLILVASAESLYKIYTAMALGHLAKKHRVGWSVAAYLGISFLGSAIWDILLFNADWDSIGDVVYRMMNGMSIPQSIVTMELIAIVFYAILSVIFFFVTRHILEKRLNLE